MTARLVRHWLESGRLELPLPASSGATAERWRRMAALAAVMRRECPAPAPGATVVSAHWRHDVDDCPLSGDATDVIAATPGLTPLGRYRDVVIAVFDTGAGVSVVSREGVPGSR